MLACEPAVIITVCDQGRVTFRRSNVAGRVPPLGTLEIESWKEAHDRGTPNRRIGGAWQVAAWPVHEEGWQREILRTEVGGIDG
jgi:hypothetical protein